MNTEKVLKILEFLEEALIKIASVLESAEKEDNTSALPAGKTDTAQEMKQQLK